MQTAKPLPPSDRVGAVVGLLLLPLLIGGYLAAVLVFKAAGGTAAAPWRALILTGYAIVGAVLTDLIAGPLIGAYSSSHFWPLLPCFALVTTAVVLAAAAIQGLAGTLGTLLVAVLFIVVGGSAAGGSGTFLLPVYWRNIGVLFPPQNAVDLIRNVLYFGGNNITTPLIVLFAYGLAGVAVISYLNWNRPARQARAAARARAEVAEAAPAGNPGANPPGPRRGMLPILVALGVCAVMECLFAFNYMSAGHAPKATRHAVRRHRIVPDPHHGRKDLLPQGHPLPGRSGGQGRDRPGEDLGRPDPGQHRGRPEHPDRRPVHQRPVPARHRGCNSSTRRRSPGRSSRSSSTRRSRWPKRTRSAWSSR